VPRLLVVDDEASVCYSFRRVFSARGVEVLSASTAEAGLEMLHKEHPDVLVLDLQLPDRSGMEVFAAVRESDARLPVIFITAHGTTDTAIEAMKQGAFDYLVKPVDFDRIRQVIERAFEAARLMRTPALLPRDDGGDRIVGRSPIIQEMSKAIGRVAAQDVTVLIQGESGTGKELVARAIYQHSRRADKPFLAINCAAIPETLLESELFGYEAGAFTGANRRRVGKFEQCNGGTLFLDEIGDMSPAVQAKMLRILQEQCFEPLGSGQSVRTQVRILAATNQDLEKLVEEGRFRKDLYYRLKVVTIQVPPLRDRLEDVVELAHYFLSAFNRELSRDVRGFAPETLLLFHKHPWPGNVRELQGVIKQAILNATGHLILPEDLPPGFDKNATAAAATAGALDTPDLHQIIRSLIQNNEKNIYDKVLAITERVLLTEVLMHTHGHQAQASDLLGLNRTTLRYKLRNLGLTVDKVVAEDAPSEA
jgi:two-component system, NtrC family, nitrogen regulation response regulator GlnG